MNIKHSNMTGKNETPTPKRQKQSAALFDALAESIGALIWEADPHTLQYRGNVQQVASWPGHPAAEAVSWPDHIHPQDRQRILAECTGEAIAGSTCHLEYRLRSTGACQLWVQDIVILETGDDQSPILHGVRLDITHRKQSQLLQEFARVVENSLDYREIVGESLQLLGRVLKFGTASIYLCASDNQAEFAAMIGYGDQESTTGKATPLLRSIDLLGQLAQDHKPIIVGDIYDQPGWKGLSGTAHARSFLAVPLMERDHMAGTLILDSKEIDFFRQEDLEIVMSIAHQIAASIKYARLLDGTQQQLTEKTAIMEASMAVTSSLDLEVVLSNMAQQLGKVVDVASSYICDWSPKENRSKVLVEYHSPDVEGVKRNSVLGREFDLQKDLGDRADWLLERRPVVVHADDPNVNSSEREYMRREGGISALYVPLVAKGLAIGYAALWETRYRRAFTKEEIALCQAIAQQAANALANARLFEETSQRANELMILHQVALMAAEVVNVDDMLQQISTLISNTVYSDAFGFVLVDQESGALRPHHSFQGVPPEYKQAVVRPEGSIVGRVAQTGEPFMCADVHQVPFYFEGVSTTRSEISVPLKVHGQVMGVINVESPHEAAFDSNDLRFLVTLAGQVAAAIERVRLYEALQQHADRLKGEVDARTAELQSARDQTMVILESAGESIVLTDATASILYVNPAFQRQSGYSRDELLGMNANVFMSSQTAPAIQEDMVAAISQGQSWSGELVNERKDGTYFDGVLTINPIHDSVGKLTGFVGIMSDISRLKELDRLKSQFVSTVSHELRTPLTNIKMYLTLLERGSEEKRQRFLKVLHHETERLERLIQDLLDLSKLDTEPLADWSAATDLDHAIRKQYENFTAKAETKQILFQMDLAPFLPSALIEDAHLEQLLTNLLGNAFAYTPSGGEVTIACGTKELFGQPMIWIRVIDNGPGILPEELPNLFHRFFRGSSAATSGVPGTGLGLAICMEIIDRYKGKLEVESEPGIRTTFTAWLPIAF